MSRRVRITDVSPRDGLQNEAGVIATADKVRLVDLLCRTGVDEVEVTSFVSAKWVPQLGDAREVFAGVGSLDHRHHAVTLSALVPNERGMDAAEEARRHTGLPGKVSVFTAASETFCKRNINATIAESLERFKPVIARAKGACGGGGAPLPVRGYLSCVIACPFEGPIDPAAVAVWANELADMGVDELDLGDTIGAGTPETMRAMLRHVHAVCPLDGSRLPITLHLHDTFGRAGECVRVALDMGVRSFDGSVAGLGGCPYASTPGWRAPGNIDTDLLVRTIHDAGFTTGVNRERLGEAAAFARQIVAASRAST